MPQVSPATASSLERNSTHSTVPPALAGKVAMLYDGGCPLCSREVAHYRRVDRAERVNWVDIYLDASVLVSLGIDKTAAMKRLHVLDQHGGIVTGASAFAVVWAELPRYRVLAKLVQLPGVMPLLNRAYDWFAEKRFAKRSRCDSGVCS